jgi:sugar O-acyltransferase (sialic acid O-acetyltransferase NeuD family)
VKPLLLLVGGGGHCHSCIEAIESGGKYSIMGIIGLTADIGQTVLGYQVVGTDSDLSKMASEAYYAIVTLGQIKSPQPRMRLFEIVRDLRMVTPAISASTAIISRHARVGVGSIVMHGALLNAGSQIGENSIINSHALIEHDVRVGDHSHISTAAILNGGVEVGCGTFIGSGAVVHQCVRIGNNAIVGAGAIVSRDIGDGEVVRVRVAPESRSTIE